jgi:glutamine synthetase
MDVAHKPGGDMNTVTAERASGPAALEVLRRLEEDAVQLVNLQFVDITGTLKGITIPAAQLPAVIERGKWFDGSAIDAFARTAESDMYLWPDLSTYAPIPWKTGQRTTARLFCWIRTPAGDPFAGDPRAALTRLVAGAREQGYAYSTAVEVEFFLLPPGDVCVPEDETGYFSVTQDSDEQIVEETVAALRRMGAPAVSHHHEVAEHQHEVDFEVVDALAAADSVITLKYVLRSIARRHGLRVTFMPKPWQGKNGSGMHAHQYVSRQGDAGGVDDEYGLPAVAHGFIAGQLHHARGMCALIAPIVNSYKRFVVGHEAPVYLSWARHSRSAFIRVPQLSADGSANPETGGSLELRAPDPTCNPYLAFAAMLECGLDGIRRGLTLLPPVEESLYDYDVETLRRQSVGIMPSSLGEALDAMEADLVVQGAIGDYLSSRFLELKSLEWRAYLEHVGDWELARYLELS